MLSYTALSAVYKRLQPGLINQANPTAIIKRPIWPSKSRRRATNHADPNGGVALQMIIERTRGSIPTFVSRFCSSTIDEGGHNTRKRYGNKIESRRIKLRALP